MTLKLARRYLTFVLAILLTVSLNLAAVEASGMASEVAKMASMSGMDNSISGHCQKCSGNGNHAAMIAFCGTTCSAPVPVMLPQEATVTLAFKQMEFLRPVSLLRGMAPAPDPHPPRSHKIG